MGQGFSTYGLGDTKEWITKPFGSGSWESRLVSPYCGGEWFAGWPSGILLVQWVATHSPLHYCYYGRVFSPPTVLFNNKQLHKLTFETVVDTHRLRTLPLRVACCCFFCLQRLWFHGKLPSPDHEQISFGAGRRPYSRHGMCHTCTLQELQIGERREIYTVDFTI